MPRLVQPRQLPGWPSGDNTYPAYYTLALLYLDRGAYFDEGWMR